MILISHPAPWNSVHRPIEYVYDHDSRFISGVLVNTGRLEVYLTTAFTLTPVAGEKVYLSGVLDAGDDISGEYEIYSVAGSVIVIDVLVSTPTLNAPSELLYLRIPEIELYSGYLAGEEYPDDLDITLVATFTPENSPTNDVRFDVSEYLKSIFRILPPVEGIDFNMFNRFRLKFDGVYHEFYMVLNSSIKTAKLNAVYVESNAPLNSEIPPIVFGCGKTILSYLTGNVVENLVYDGEIPDHGDYNNDFSNDYHNE